jgi:hypothetical protein
LPRCRRNWWASSAAASTLRIPVMWAPDSGDVGSRRSEATLVGIYSNQAAHMSQEQDR